MKNDVEHFFHVLIVHLSSLIKCLFRSFIQFLFGFFVFLSSEGRCSLHILRTFFVIRWYVFHNYFLLVCNLCFYSFKYIFCTPEFLNLNKIHLMFMDCTFGVVSKNSSLNKGHVDYIPVLFQKFYRFFFILYLVLWLLELKIAWDIKFASGFFFVCFLQVDIQVSWYHLPHIHKHIYEINDRWIVRK